MEPPKITRTAAAVKQAEIFVNATSVKIILGLKAIACYSPTADVIHMPLSSRFKSKELHIATLLHELVHWTMLKSRCGRKVPTNEAEYAFEELVAELGAAYLCAAFGVRYGLGHHADYLAHWISLLEADSRAIFRAASQASKAVRYLRNVVNKPVMEMRRALP